jgi:hypothetical protein
MRNSAARFWILWVLLTLVGCKEGINAGECSDGADNDGDGAFDCEDEDCIPSWTCSNFPGRFGGGDAATSATILGVVIDGVSGAAIEGVEIVANQGSGALSATTDGTGIFQIGSAIATETLLVINTHGYHFFNLTIDRSEFHRQETSYDDLTGEGTVNDTADQSNFWSSSDGPVVASIEIVLTPTSTGEEVDQVLSGLVVRQDWVPIPDATVLLINGINIVSETATDPAGAFAFPDITFTSTSDSYDIVVLPIDLDLDGWADTGSGTIAGVNYLTAANNLIVRMDAPAYSLNQSNACHDGFVPAGGSIFFVWNSSVVTTEVQIELSDPLDVVLPTTNTFTGGYLLEVVPDTPLVATADPADIYHIKVIGLSYADDHVESYPIGTDPTIPALDCAFRVGQ